jgi:hypothetical protein
VIVTRPSVTSGKFTKEDVVKKRQTLMFFGNFHKNGIDEGIVLKDIADDKDYLFSANDKDFKILGKVFRSKMHAAAFKLHNVFIIGIIILSMHFCFL